MYDQRPGISTLMTHVPSHTFSTRRSCHFKDRKGAHFRRQHPCLDIQASRSGAGLTPSDSPSDQVEQSLILLATTTGSEGGKVLLPTLRVFQVVYQEPRQNLGLR